MYVCICHAVTDREIREEVERGASSLFDVQCRLPVASCCGRCEETARQVIDEHCRASVAGPGAAGGAANDQRFWPAA